MGSFPYDLALIGTQMVGRCEIFIEIQKSRLDLFGFGNRICQREDNYVKTIII